jgi:hypothetical protein
MQKLSQYFAIQFLITENRRREGVHKFENELIWKRTLSWLLTGRQYSHLLGLQHWSFTLGDE